MKIIDLHAIIDSNCEDEVHSKIGREVFFDILLKADIDLEKLAAKTKKNDYEPYHSFNFIVKELNDTKKIEISDACIYLETQIFTPREIMACLNEENLYMLKCNLAERNNIQMKKNSLDSFML